MTRMDTVDNLWKDNMSEFIFDDKRVVTFKFLSATLGVHVNIAKQMLYQFHATQKAEGKKIYATYYVSGAIIQGRSIDPSVSETQNCHDPSSGKHGYVVTLCREKDLDTVKHRIMKVHSVHIYALSAFPLDNLDILQKAMNDPIFKTVNPVDFGPLHCKAALKVRESNAETKLQQQENKNITDSTANKPDKKKEVNVISASGKTDLKSTHDDQSSAKSSSDRKTVSTASNKKTNEQSDSRLKSMFATAASKPKKAPVIEKKSADTFEKKLDEKKEVNVKEGTIVRNYNKQKEKIIASKAKQSESRKRKRIKDVLSSSSEDERPSDDECSPAEPDSPNHRKRNLIESDSDEDIQDVVNIVKKPRSEEPVGPTGRRKVSKTVSKTFMDKDGYLVTTKEQVMISEPETSDTETVSTQNDTDESKLSKNESNKINEKISDNKANDAKTNSKAKIAKPSSAAATATKSKQSSLFSFFQKK